MFTPRHFAEEDRAIIVELLRRTGFGHLVVGGTGGLDSTPLPFVVDRHADESVTSLRAHLARPNALWRLAPCEALVIVPVADTYISPSWYPSKADHGRVVPTWNYEVVHLHGRLEAHDDPAWVLQLVSELTHLHEAAMPAPWAVDDAPTEFVEQQLRAIVGVELVVERIEAKRKLSQNKSTADIAGAIDGLDSSPHRGAAEIRAGMIESYVEGDVDRGDTIADAMERSSD